MPATTLAVAEVRAWMNPTLRGTARRGEWCVRLLGARGRRRRARIRAYAPVAMAATWPAEPSSRPRWQRGLEDADECGEKGGGKMGSQGTRGVG